MKRCILCNHPADYEWTVYDHHRTACDLPRESILILPTCAAHFDRVANDATRKHFQCMAIWPQVAAQPGGDR